jgi:hypothetical protein
VPADYRGRGIALPESIHRIFAAAFRCSGVMLLDCRAAR